ncbi:helix-turn-helix protein [Flavobacteriaceae bacterium MAR_2009_75]|nr:helix-turn-helix protein [Flavobacteriaceae bacterium MAR_2009_75]
MSVIKSFISNNYLYFSKNSKNVNGHLLVINSEIYVMNDDNNVLELLKDIKRLLSFNKKVLNVEDLANYTGLSKSKIYKLTQLKLIPTGNNQHIRQKFFHKDVIDAWLLGELNLSDEYLENKMNELFLK